MTMPANETPPSTVKEQKGEAFLLRLTPDLRKKLDVFRTEKKAKSLQTLILQFIVEGMSRDGFTPAQLFSKDLHARQLGMAVKQVSDLEPGNTRISMGRKGSRTRFLDSDALKPSHERVLEALESQKLTSFAALMDPALMSYRLLSDFCDPGREERDPDSLNQDFANGLWFAAEKAMLLKKWSFAQILLRQACDLDPENEELVLATGIYMIKRLMVSGWDRRKESVGVPAGELPFGFSQRVEPGATAEESGVITDQAEWVMVEDAHKLLLRGAFLSDEESTFGHERSLLECSSKMQCWRDLATIILWASSEDDVFMIDQDGGWKHGLDEKVILERITDSLRQWAQAIKRTTREQSALQREWSDWLDALEVFWLLGYRKEAFKIAKEVRNFTSDEDGVIRLRRLKCWDPSNEVTLEDGEYANVEENIFVHPDGNVEDKSIYHARPFRTKLI